MNFWDMDRNGKFDITDIFWIALQVIAYTSGLVLMGSTFTRSFHLLSSPAFNPSVDGFGWWPFITAVAPEVGLVIAWLSGEVGFRKGRVELVGLSVVGFIVFAVVIGTLGIYDVALVEGQDVTEAASWAHFIASILPLITIGYIALSTMLLSYMARRDKLKGGDTDWQVRPQRRPQPQPRRGLPDRDNFDPRVTLPRIRPESDFGSPVTDPTDKHRTATRVAERAVSTLRSNGNGSGENHPS